MCYCLLFLNKFFLRPYLEEFYEGLLQHLDGINTLLDIVLVLFLQRREKMPLVSKIPLKERIARQI